MIATRLVSVFILLDFCSAQVHRETRREQFPHQVEILIATAGRFLAQYEKDIVLCFYLVTITMFISLMTEKFASQLFLRYLVKGQFFLHFLGYFAVIFNE